MDTIWFDSWESIRRISLVTPVAYVAVVFSLRISGKRTLSKMNAFDFVVTVALGSILATVSLNHGIPLADGVLALALFIGFQFVFTWLSVRVKAVKTLITSKPSLIFYQGRFLEEAMKRERITEEEIYSAARQKGISTLDEIDMIVLETTGDLSVIKTIKSHTNTSFEDVVIER